ncbi:MAG: hypothetical protein RIS76_991 [Verrucomicrobiota bacterium]|jgi:hypothetical protein
MFGDSKQEWLDLLTSALDGGTLVKVSLGAPRRPDAPVRKLLARPVSLREGLRLQLVWQMATHDVTKNLEAPEGVERIGELMGTDFCVGNLFTTERTAQLEFRKGRAGRVVYTAPATTVAAETGHDRVKPRTVEAARPWLQALGITTTTGAVCKGHESKFRQIHRFVELMDPLLVEAGILGEPGKEAGFDGAPVRLWDMGCGKGALTFALHEHLCGRAPRPVTTRGVEARPALVEGANRVVRDAGCTGLEFVAGTIADVPREAVDVLVALHACDTATDDALAAGVASGASLLVVSPCCHQEVRSQLVAPPVLASVLQHGILREREAELVTDGLRAALLDWAGYEPRVFEFISPEHSGKNLMIAGLKRRQPADRDAAARRVRDLAAFYGIRRQRLAEAMGFDLTGVV